MTTEQKTKKRPFYYRRAKWDEQRKDKSLEELLITSHVTLKTVGARTFIAGEGEIRGADFEARPGQGVFLHVASYVPDEQTTTIEKDTAATRTKLYAETASAGRNFLGGDIFVYVKDNHLILCPSGVRETVAFSYIYQVLQKCKHHRMLASFQLEKVAKASKLAMIASEGVKAIELNSSLYEASLDHVTAVAKKKKDSKFKVEELLKKTAEFIEEMFAEDADLKEIKEKENLDIKLSLRFDGREARKKGKAADFGVLGKSRLKKTSEAIVAEFEKGALEDGFIIVTGEGNTITPDEIRVSESFRVEVFGKSLNRDDAYLKLKGYYDKLKGSGVLSK